MAPSVLASGVFGASVRSKRFVALHFIVPHHFIEGFAGGRLRRVEDPSAFGATPTPKTLPFNPYLLPAHAFTWSFATLCKEIDEVYLRCCGCLFDALHNANLSPCANLVRKQSTSSRLEVMEALSVRCCEVSFAQFCLCTLRRVEEWKKRV